MFADFLYTSTESLGRRSRRDALDDRLLADMGLTRADAIKGNRLFGRKAKRG